MWTTACSKVLLQDVEHADLLTVNVSGFEQQGFALPASVAPGAETCLGRAGLGRAGQGQVQGWAGQGRQGRRMVGQSWNVPMQLQAEACKHFHKALHTRNHIHCIVYSMALAYY